MSDLRSRSVASSAACPIASGARSASPARILVAAQCEPRPQFPPSAIEGNLGRPRGRRPPGRTGGPAGRDPRLGRIAAGTPISAIQRRSDTISLPPDLSSKCEHFVLEACGDRRSRPAFSMADTVVIKKQDQAETGDIVVALIDDEGCDPQTPAKCGAFIALEAANPPMKPASSDLTASASRGKRIQPTAEISTIAARHRRSTLRLGLRGNFLRAAVTVRLVARESPGAGRGCSDDGGFFSSARPGRRRFDARAHPAARPRGLQSNLRRSITIGPPQPCGANSGVTTIVARAGILDQRGSCFSTRATIFRRSRGDAAGFVASVAARRIARDVYRHRRAATVPPRNRRAVRPSNARPLRPAGPPLGSPVALTARSKPDKDEAPIKPITSKGMGRRAQQ